MSVDFDAMVRHLMDRGATRENAERAARATLRREATQPSAVLDEVQPARGLAQSPAKYSPEYSAAVDRAAKPRRRAVPREHLSQADVFRRAREYAALHPEHAADIEAMYAVPNKAKRTEREWAEMMAEGFKKGTPDFVCPWPRVWQGRVVGALYVEMKEPKNGPSEDQLRRRDALRAAGNRVEIAWSADEAWGYVLDHLHCQTP